MCGYSNMLNGSLMARAGVGAGMGGGGRRGGEGVGGQGWGAGMRGRLVTGLGGRVWDKPHITYVLRPLGHLHVLLSPSAQTNHTSHMFLDHWAISIYCSHHLLKPITHVLRPLDHDHVMASPSAQTNHTSHIFRPLGHDHVLLSPSAQTNHTSHIFRPLGHDHVLLSPSAQTNHTSYTFLDHWAMTMYCSHHQLKSTTHHTHS